MFEPVGTDAQFSAAARTDFVRYFVFADIPETYWFQYLEIVGVVTFERCEAAEGMEFWSTNDRGEDASKLSRAKRDIMFLLYRFGSYAVGLVICLARVLWTLIQANKCAVWGLDDCESLFPNRAGGLEGFVAVLPGDG